MVISKKLKEDLLKWQDFEMFNILVWIETLTENKKLADALFNHVEILPKLQSFKKKIKIDIKKEDYNSEHEIYSRQDHEYFKQQALNLIETHNLKDLK